VEFRDLIDKLESAPEQINKKLEDLKTEKDQLLARLKEVESSIKREEDNLARVPIAISKQRALMTAKYAELKEIHAKRKQPISGTSKEDNQQIAEIDANRQNALNVIKSILNL
jgi:predicted nuclease with TOPRIM domain